jgi:hypothetical protein
MAMLNPTRTAARTNMIVTTVRRRFGTARSRPTDETDQARRRKTAPRIRNLLAFTLPPFDVADYTPERRSCRRFRLLR